MRRLEATPQSNPAFVIDRPTPADVPAILAVHQATFVDAYINTGDAALGATSEALRALVTGDDFITRNTRILESAIKPSGYLHVARLACSDEIIGFGKGASDKDEYVDKVASLYVLPAYQGIGIGSGLLRAILTELQRPIVRVDVVRWTPAVRFYKKHGFQLTAREVPAPEPPKAYGITLAQLGMELGRQPRQRR